MRRQREEVRPTPVPPPMSMAPFAFHPGSDQSFPSWYNMVLPPQSVVPPQVDELAGWRKCTAFDRGVQMAMEHNVRVNQAAHSMTMQSNVRYGPTTNHSFLQPPRVGALAVQQRAGAVRTEAPSSSSPAENRTQGQRQWAGQCATASERASAYVEAQKVWGDCKALLHLIISCITEYPNWQLS